MDEGILEKLAWAGFPVEVAIQRAANLLKEHWNLDKGPGRAQLKQLARLTNPKRGQIKARRAAIEVEWERQTALRRERENQQRTHYVGRQKHDLLQRFSKANNVRAGGLRRVGDLLLVLMGSCYGDHFEGLAVKFPDGHVDRIKFPKERFGSYTWKTFEELIVAIPRIIVGDKHLARAALEGASVVHSFANLRTTISFPDGEEIIVKWSFERVRYAPNRSDDVSSRKEH